MSKKPSFLIVALALLVVAAVPAAPAGAVTFSDAAGVIENEAEIFIQGWDMEWETSGGPVECEQLEIETTMEENAADPASLAEAPATIEGCTASWNPLIDIDAEEVEVGPITVASDGTGEMPIEFAYTVQVPTPAHCKKMQGAAELGFSSFPVEYAGWVYASPFCPLGSHLRLSGHLQFYTANGPVEVAFP
ncbi:MAG TPA: hypothetical protein VK889_03735 [Solirubrobacterales bacterium]|nr:hypothetical protein [Solirubrobacterales bacterium]